MSPSYQVVNPQLVTGFQQLLEEQVLQLLNMYRIRTSKRWI